MSSTHSIGYLDSEASGPAYSVPRLAQALVAHGHRAELITLGRPGCKIEKGVRVTRHKPDPVGLPILARLGRSRSMSKALMLDDAQIFHTHGLWMMPNVYPGLVARQSGRPFVLAPRGMLGRDALHFSSAVKHLFWALWQARAVSQVRCFHATAPSEYEDIRAFGLRQPVAIIPNGIDLPNLKADGHFTSPVVAPFILSLGRIHPKKGLDRLIAAFALVADEHPEWRLRIVGPDERGYAELLRRQISQQGLDGRVAIEPPLFGEDKFRLMRQAGVFALPTLNENFGMTVAESLAVGTPVIATKGAPWIGLTEHRCGWWIDHGPEPMAAALRCALTMSSEERHAMGKLGREWMARDFAWEGIGAKMVLVYAWLLGLGPKPDCVQT